jgi:pimeloyl-ACP methyl ester carboxylesterase
MTLSSSDLVTSGIVLLVVVTIAYGGTFVLRVVTGRQPANALQTSFFRAGHAHGRIAAAPDGLRSSAATLLAAGRPLLGYLGTDVRPALAAARQPGYAVWGAEDPTVPVRVAVDRLRASAGGRTRVEVVAGAGHTVPLAGGWAERASDWVRRGYPEDDVVRGAQPGSLVGLPTLPEQDLIGDPRLHLGLSALAALVAAGWPLRRQGWGSRVSTSRRG